MRALLSSTHPRLVLCLLALAGIAAAQAPSTPAADGPDSHVPPTTAKLNSLAHRLLQAGLKVNTLGDENLPPWHIKAEFQLRNDRTPQKPVTGSFEEWHTGPYQWKRVYTSTADGQNGTEWSASRFDRFMAKRDMNRPAYNFMQVRISRPVVDPLYQAAYIKPDYEMNAIHTTTAGVTLNCASVVNGARYTEEPDFIFATTCFDTDLHLRLTVAGDTSVQFDDVQMFEGRAVARDVKVIQNGTLLAEMKVSLLEPLPPGSEALVKPPADAISEPYTIESGLPRPEAVYETAASLPLPMYFAPYSGVVPVPIVIHKDGSVKVQRGDFYVSNQLGDALESAIDKWKYKPYLLDGEPVEVAQVVAYPIDGKPFVPSYDRPKPKPVVTAPDDFSSAYDPKRDPQKDLEMAKSQASAAHKRILVEVGGDWCSWCKILDKFFEDHAGLRDQRNSAFVLLKVNMSGNNENAVFLSHYPRIPGYPWIFVLDSDGKLLKSEDTDALEKGPGYSEKAIEDFLTAWKP